MLPHIACIVLAAGRSTRMVGNKMLVDVGGKPMVRHAAEAALASNARPVLVVIGHRGKEVAEALAGLEVEFVDNPDYAFGLSSSLKRGIIALPKWCEAAIVLLGDMPEIAPGHIDRLILEYAKHDRAKIIVPTFEGRRGNPVLWPVAYFAEMMRLEGDTGAKQLLTRHGSDVVEVDLGADAIFADVDTPEALAEVRARKR